jgi:isoquinoline 1-oxidoreductase beta subunit
LAHPREIDRAARHAPEGRWHAQFGIDVFVPEMLVGTIAGCPVFGGKLKAVDDKPALAVREVKAVVKLPDAVAVVGEGYWPCKKGLQALSPQWDEGPYVTLDSERIATALNYGFGDEGAVAETHGDAAAALQKAAKAVEAIYTLPFLAHATMEPMNATARVTADGCEIWAPTQIPQWAQKVVAKTLGLEPEQVKINTTYLGGGFGRKFEIDFIVQAVMIAKSCSAAIWIGSRIASPEMFPEAEMLPHLICSRPIFIGGANDEADQHGGA